MRRPGFGTRAANASRPRAGCALPPRAGRGGREASFAGRSLRSSRPRRSRELTVPRGRSSCSAISPGVYPSRWRSTITARCSGRAPRAPPSIVRRRAGAARAPRGRRRASFSRREARARAQSIARLTTIRCSQGAERAAPVEPVERADRGRNASWAMSSAAAAIVDDQEGGPVGVRPVRAEELLERVGGPPLRRTQQRPSRRLERDIVHPIIRGTTPSIHAHPSRELRAATAGRSTPGADLCPRVRRMQEREPPRLLLTAAAAPFAVRAGCARAARARRSRS